MNEQLKQLKKRLKRENQLPGSDNSQESRADAFGQSSGGTSGSAIDHERKAVLSAGKRFVRPLTTNPQRAMKVTALVVAGFIVAILAGFAVWIYQYQGDNDTVYQASQIVPYPAACVGGSPQWVPYPHPCAGGELIEYDQYLLELRTLKQRERDPVGGGEGVDFTTQEGKKRLENLRLMALQRAQHKTIIRQIAEERNVDVPEGRVREKIAQFKKNSGGEQQLTESLRQVYGWDMDDFRAEVRSQLLRQAIMRQRGTEILQKAKSEDTDFQELARKHATGDKQGDVGYVTQDSQFSPEFKRVALSLDEGEISSLVQTESKFHIMKATDKHPVKGTRISHILIDNTKLRRQTSRRLQNTERRSYIGVPLQSKQQNGQAEAGAEQ
jgi:uncharacterized membrane protein